MDTKKILIWAGVAVAVLLVLWAVVAWLFPGTPGPTSLVPSFGLTNAPSTSVTPNQPASITDTNVPTLATGASSSLSTKRVFAIAPGPIAGAILIQTLHPTTTVARYIDQNNGHVYDLALDVPGAAPRTVSNTTIPGAQRVLWAEKGNAVLLQYLNGDTIKTVYLGFPQLATTTSGVGVQAVRVQFLPDNMRDIAVSPDGNNIVYLLQTASGSDGYVAKTTGAGSVKLFSLPLSQVTVNWPSANIILATTKNAQAVPGITFSIDTKTGVATPLLYAQGLSTTADASFAHVLYETNDANMHTTYVRDMKNGTDGFVSFNPMLSKCAWSNTATTTIYCATPPEESAPEYIDAWNKGLVSSTEQVFMFNILTKKTQFVATPGSILDGGVGADITALSVSLDDRYLSFISKGSRVLWGVRLGR